MGERDVHPAGPQIGLGHWSRTSGWPTVVLVTSHVHAADAPAGIAAEQGGVLTRQQLCDLGVPLAIVRSRLRARAWQQAFPGVYVIFTGPLPFVTRVWASLLYAGPGSCASHHTAAYLAGLQDRAPDVLDISVPHGRRLSRQAGVRIHQSRRLGDARHPVRQPPQTRIEDTVLDLSDSAPSAEPVIDVVLRACQRRLTTPARLRERARARTRLRWRRLIDELLEDVSAGVLTPLEQRYLRDVEQAHGLPRGEYNSTDGPVGRRRYRDVRYHRYRTLVELDGQAAHPADRRELDDLRDNEVAEQAHLTTLRYGWRSVTTRRCSTAGQIARVFTGRGWTGTPTRCGPHCSLDWPDRR